MIAIVKWFFGKNYFENFSIMNMHMSKEHLYPASSAPFFLLFLEGHWNLFRQPRFHTVVSIDDSFTVIDVWFKTIGIVSGRSWGVGTKHWYGILGQILLKCHTCHCHKSTIILAKSHFWLIKKCQPFALSELTAQLQWKGCTVSCDLLLKWLHSS